MGKIKKIQENELIGGTQDTDVYPITSTKAVYDEDNERLDNIIKRIGIVNIPTIYNKDHITEILTLSQAITKVPSDGRVLGFQGKYIASDGWHTIIFIGNNLTDWEDKTKWIDLADKVFNSISKNATFAGIASPITNPGIPDGPVFYLAFQSGVYSNFAEISIQKEAAILKWDNKQWTKIPTEFVVNENLIALDKKYENIIAGINETLENLSADTISYDNSISIKQAITEKTFIPTPKSVGVESLSDNVIALINSSGGGTIVNNVDDEDLTVNSNNLIKFKNKRYEPLLYSGKGRIYLRKNISTSTGTNLLLQTEINTPNVIYIIQYDYDLNGKTIELSEGAILKFEGGSFSNGTLKGKNTIILANKGDKIFPNNISIQGTWLIENSYSSWFNPAKNGYKISAVRTIKTTVKETVADTTRTTTINTTTIHSGKSNTDTETTSVVDSNITADKTTTTTVYKYQIEGVDTWFDAQTKPTGITYDDDTVKLQQLLNLGADTTTIEEGIYMVDVKKYNYNKPTALCLFEQNNKTLVLNGWLKQSQFDNVNSFVLSIQGCDNITITGNGGIQGDLPEHKGTAGEGGMLIAVDSTKNLLVENIELSYAWGDCIYAHWLVYNNKKGNNNQHNHTYRNLKITFGGRTGIVYERGDAVTIDKCYFENCGQYRGKEMKSAINFEPFGSSDTPKRYCENIVFSNNTMKACPRNIRFERCCNISIHGNIVEDGWCGIELLDCKHYSYDGDDKTWKYVGGILEVYSNYVVRCPSPVYIDKCQHLYFYNNVVIEGGDYYLTSYNFANISDSVIYNNKSVYSGTLFKIIGTVKNIDIHNNILMGAKYINYGSFIFCNPYSGNVIENINVYNNYIYSCNGQTFKYVNNGEPIYTSGAASLVLIKDYTGENMLKFSNNYIDPKLLHTRGNVEFEYYNAHNGKELYVTGIKKDNDSLFFKGETVISNKYCQEGYVTKSMMANFDYLPELTNGLVVDATNLLFRNSDSTIKYFLEIGDTVTDAAKGKVMRNGTEIAAPSTRVILGNIMWNTVGKCTSTDRPTTLNFKGRRLLETDTNLLIEYDGKRFIVVSNNYMGKDANKPTLTAYDIGVEYYATDTGIKMIWNGTKWLSYSPTPS